MLPGANLRVYQIPTARWINHSYQISAGLADFGADWAFRCDFWNLHEDQQGPVLPSESPADALPDYVEPAGSSTC